jgi:hypothetical protein
MAPANRFRVAHKPVKDPGTGNWAVVQRATGRIRSRHGSQAAARRSAGIRGRAVRATRARKLAWDCEARRLRRPGSSC